MDAIEPSLSSLVYGELKRELNEGLLRPGEFIDLKAFSKKLGLSMSPLRDALIRLEGEGFLQIYPRRGVMVRRLEFADIRNIYEVVGALEAAVAAESVEELGPEDFARMEGLCSLMDGCLDKGSFSAYAKANRDFHDIYLGRSNNPELLASIRLGKERLYDFSRPSPCLEEWERASTAEHRRLASLFRARSREGVASYLRDVHWSYRVQEPFIRRFYGEIEAGNGGRP
jgi:DNA-binding GntR family transcriptional regulator